MALEYFSKYDRYINVEEGKIYQDMGLYFRECVSKLKSG